MLAEISHSFIINKCPYPQVQLQINNTIILQLSNPSHGRSNKKLPIQIDLRTTKEKKDNTPLDTRVLKRLSLQLDNTSYYYNQGNSNDLAIKVPPSPNDLITPYTIYNNNISEISIDILPLVESIDIEETSNKGKSIFSIISSLSTYSTYI